MTKLTRCPADKVSAQAGLHSDNARRQPPERLNERQSLDLATKSDLASVLKPTTWKTSLPMPMEAKDVVVMGCFFGCCGVASQTIPAREAAGPSHPDVPSQAHGARFSISTRTHSEVHAPMERVEEKAGRTLLRYSGLAAAYHHASPGVFSARRGFRFQLKKNPFPGAGLSNSHRARGCCKFQAEYNPSVFPCRGINDQVRFV